MENQNIKEEKTNFIKDIIIPIIIALVIALLLRTFVVGSYYVPSGSMIPTLQLNDHVIVTKFTYHFSKPKRGDIVVFKYPPNVEQNMDEVDYVKRLIGLPGEKLEIKNNKVYINDNAIEETYVNADTNMPDFGPIDIPEGQYFMMGDNRNNSSDSRVWGFVPQKDLIGKAQFIYYPFNRVGGLK